MYLTFIYTSIYASLPNRSGREDGVTVTDQETVRIDVAKLLQGPGRGWMCDDLAMHDAPCPELHQDEHIESLQPGSLRPGNRR